MNEKIIDTMELIRKPSIRGTIAKMKVGQELHIPFEMGNSNSIRNAASILGATFDRRYAVHKDNERKAYTITRLS